MTLIRLPELSIWAISQMFHWLKFSSADYILLWTVEWFESTTYAKFFNKEGNSDLLQRNGIHAAKAMSFLNFNVTKVSARHFFSLSLLALLICSKYCK